MCGLVGIAGDLSWEDDKRIERMLMLDWFRGKDSTGLASVRNSGEVKIAKVCSHPIDLFDMGRYKEATSGTSCAYIGHNRAATRGEVSHTNAHPWRFGNIVGAHNGTLWPGSHKELNNLLGEDYPVDSMAVFAAIDALGLKEALKRVEGAYALTWLNLEEGTMNFIRNKDRPLWWAKDVEKNKIYWASTWGIIKGGLAESERASLDTNAEGHFYFEFLEDVHYSFDIRDLKDKKKEIKPKCTKVEGRKYTPLTGRLGQSHGGYHARVSDPFERQIENDHPSVIHLPSKTTNYQTTSRHSVAFKTKETTDEDPYGGLITREKFDELSKYGCSNCSRDIEWGDELAYWDRDDTLLCHHCSGLGNGVSRIYTTQPIMAESA